MILKNLKRFIPIRYVLGLLLMVMINVFLFFGTYYITCSYEKKAMEQLTSNVEKQCSMLADQVSLNGISAYNMTNISGDRGSNLDYMEKLANDIGGRVLIVDSNFQIVSDTYNTNNGQFYVTGDLIQAFMGEDTGYSYVGDDYVQVISCVYNQESGDICALVLAQASVKSIRDITQYLEDQRATLIGIFFFISLVLTIILVLFLRNSFGAMQKELDIIAAGHQEEQLEECGFRELYMMSTSINRIINHYKELENSRQEFVSNVSHELKTPITSMKILADSLLMQENVPTEIYEEFMQDIVHEIDRENQIINDLLNLVKMDKTQADLNIAPVNINELLEMLLKRISPIAEERDITIRLETMRQVVAEVDEVKLSLACNNIIENAVEYNNDGGKVDVSLNGDHKFFYIRVKDTGIGIPEDCQEQIFERFYRVDKARSRETGGTGLGLSIARNVVLMHKGSIRVHSKEGEGTTFIIRIPLNYLG